MIHQGTDQPINESSTNGPRIEWMNGRSYECTYGRIALSITRYKSTNDGPSGGSFTEAPNGSIDEWAEERSSQRETAQ